MKKQISLTIFSIVFILSACQPPVTFDKPQPADVNALAAFPNRLLGKYLSTEDNSLLILTKDAMIRIYDYQLKVHVSQLDSTKQLIGDTLFDLKTNRGTAVQIEGDSIVEQIHEVDTVFRIDPLNVLKKYKGYYFINIYTTPSTWQVQELEFSRGTLTVGEINSQEDIAQLKAITESAQDTVPYVFSPTKKEFRTFVKNEGFRNTEKFMKIKE